VIAEKAFARTTKVIDFFKEELGFINQEIIYFTEDEARILVELLDQSRIFKHYD